MGAYKVAVFLALCGLFFLMAFGPDKWNQAPEESPRTLMFKMLPMLTLLLMVHYTKPLDNAHRRYKQYVYTGLVFSMCGDMALVWKTDLFIPGLLFFAIAHVCYMLGFRFRPLGLGSGLLCMTSATVLVQFFLPQIKEGVLKYLVAMYIYMIFTMFWRSHVRWQQDPRWDSLSASIGAVIFIVSDFIIAFTKWHHDIYLGSVGVMVTYYLAQLLISLSVVHYSPPHDADIREKKEAE